VSSASCRGASRRNPSPSSWTLSRQNLGPSDVRITIVTAGEPSSFVYRTPLPTIQFAAAAYVSPSRISSLVTDSSKRAPDTWRLAVVSVSSWNVSPESLDHVHTYSQGSGSELLMGAQAVRHDTRRAKAAAPTRRCLEADIFTPVEVLPDWRERPTITWYRVHESLPRVTTATRVIDLAVEREMGRGRQVGDV
jgi:hypothetical protein